MKITVEFELDRRSIQIIQNYSLERFLNNAFAVGRYCEKSTKVSQHINENGSDLEQAALTLKEVAPHIWNEIRNELFKQNLI